MILSYNRLGNDDVAIQVAAQVPASGAAASDPVNIWPFVKAGVISGLTVYFLTKFLNGGKR